MPRQHNHLMQHRLHAHPSTVDHTHNHTAADCTSDSTDTGWRAAGSRMTSRQLLLPKILHTGDQTSFARDSWEILTRHMDAAIAANYLWRLPMGNILTMNRTQSKPLPKLDRCYDFPNENDNFGRAFFLLSISSCSCLIFARCSSSMRCRSSSIFRCSSINFSCSSAWNEGREFMRSVI